MTQEETYVFYQPPLTEKGQRDWAKEARDWLKFNAGNLNLSQNTITLIENLSNEIERLQKSEMSPDRKKQLMLDLWGPKCEEFQEKCGCCEAWKFFEDKGYVPLVDDL